MGSDINFTLINEKQYECNDERVQEFLKLTGLKPWYKRNSPLKDKMCLDAGCGPGRWTCAMLRLGAAKVDSFDISPEAVKLCSKINPKAYVFDLMKLEPNPVYDFVISWGVIHHIPEPRKAFGKVVSQVKKGGILHVMVYNKENDYNYEEGRKVWPKLSLEEKIKFCEKMVREKGGDVHGWWDAFNPKYNFSYTPEEIKNWFEEEGFKKIKLIKTLPSINMNGVLN